MNPLTSDLIRGAQLIVGDKLAEKEKRIREKKALVKAEAAAFADEQRRLGNQGTQAYLEDKDLLDRAYVDPMGEDQSDFQNFRADDRGYTADEETGLIRRETFDESKGQYMGQEVIDRGGGVKTYTGNPIYGEYTNAPQSVLVDALSDIKKAEMEQKGLSGLLSRIVGGGAELQEGLPQAEQALRRHLESGRADDAGAVNDLILADRQRRNPLREAYSDVKAQIEAEQILRGNLSRTGVDALERAGQIREIGSSGSLKGAEASKLIMEEPMQGYAETRLYPGSTAYVDPRTGTPIGTQGPELPPHLLMQATSPNNMGTRDQLNAPMTATDWALARQPNFRSSESGSSFGDYPQVDITLETTNMSNKLKELSRNPAYKELAGVSDNVRSLDEYQRVVDFIVDRAKQNNLALRVRAPEGSPQPRPSRNPGAEEVAAKLFQTTGDEERFANALIQLEVAKQRGLNMPQSEAYRGRTPLQGPALPGAPQVAYDAPEALNEKAMMTQLSQVPKGSKIKMRGPLEDRPVGTPANPKSLMDRSIRAELRARGQKPYIAAERGKEVPTGRGLYSGRDEIATREDKMKQILENKAKREAKERRENPMRIRRKPTREDDIYTQNIADLRNKQVRTYVAQKRAERDAARRRSQEKEIMAALLPSDQRMRRSFR